LPKEFVLKPPGVGEYLVVDSRICHGRLTVKGARVPVETILNRLAKGRTVDELLASWPELAREAIDEVVLLAREAL